MTCERHAALACLPPCLCMCWCAETCEPTSLTHVYRPVLQVFKSGVVPSWKQNVHVLLGVVWLFLRVPYFLAP